MLLITTNADNDATLTVRNPNIMSQIAELRYKSSIELLSLSAYSYENAFLFLLHYHHHYKASYLPGGPNNGCYIPLVPLVAQKVVKTLIMCNFSIHSIQTAFVDAFIQKHKSMSNT